MIWTQAAENVAMAHMYRAPKLYANPKHKRLYIGKVQVEAAVNQRAYSDEQGRTVGPHYLGIWYLTRDFTSETLHGLDPATHLQRSQELMEQDYRPVAIDAAEIQPNQVVTTSCWHRPSNSAETR